MGMYEEMQNDKMENWDGESLEHYRNNALSLELARQRKWNGAGSRPNFRRNIQNVNGTMKTVSSCTASEIWRAPGCGDDKATGTVQIFDIDYVSACRTCKRALILCEAKTENEGASVMVTASTIAHELEYTAYSMFMRVAYDDYNFEKRIIQLSIVENGIKPVYNRYDVSYQDFWLEVEDIHVFHQRSGQCVGKQIPGLIDYAPTQVI